MGAERSRTPVLTIAKSRQDGRYRSSPLLASSNIWYSTACGFFQQLISWVFTTSHGAVCMKERSPTRCTETPTTGCTLTGASQCVSPRWSFPGDIDIVFLGNKERLDGCGRVTKFEHKPSQYHHQRVQSPSSTGAPTEMLRDRPRKITGDPHTAPVALHSPTTKSYNCSMLRGRWRRPLTERHFASARRETCPGTGTRP